MKLNVLKIKLASFSFAACLLTNGIFAQTNVFDDVIATSPNHTYLETALIQQGLDVVLQNPAGTFTVFAPDDAAFTAIATALGTNIAGLLALPNLTDILTYHVLGTVVPSSAVTNGAIVQPVSLTNTLKLTATASGDVYINQAKVIAVDLTASNGTVHVINGVVLPVETVVDVAIDNGFTSFTAAVVTAELLPALTNPLASLTVFAPTDVAFNDLATALGTNIAGLLAFPNLTDILTYHVLGTIVPSSAVTNGAIVQPVSLTNTLKLTTTASGDVYVNQAKVIAVDLTASNGTVHVINGVVLPVETVVDVAIDNGFTSLTAAVVTAELLPALTNPLASLTVFAPTDAAFNDLATALGTNLAGLLALPILSDVLLYHVIGSEVLSTALVNGPVATLNGQSVTISLTAGVMVNNATVVTADVLASNGVVHVIDRVLLPILANMNELTASNMSIFPNPSSDVIKFDNVTAENYTIINSYGKTVCSGKLLNNEIIVSQLVSGTYFIQLNNSSQNYQGRFVKL